MKDRSAVVNFDHIYWRRNNKEILKDVSFNIEKGEHWALLGLNGSGKTSILKMINGYQWPTNGKITVLEGQFGKVNIQNIRKSIGYVSSSLDEMFSHHFHDTALEVVISGKHASVGIYEDVQEEDIEKAKAFFPQFRISHVMEQTFSTLSQGEKRKVMLARALMGDPEIIILDEPCNGLDLLAKEDLLQAVQAMATEPNGPTLIYVTHHIEELVPAITHSLLLKDGEVVHRGPKEDVLTDEWLSKTFGLPLSVTWSDDRPWIHIRSRETL